jgi:glycosyltransferase involved in cell wall biosynthesis
MSALVSILIPAYNAEPWVGATIQAALAQTWPSTEIIIVDDGSRDGTLAVARRFESRAVKIVTQENMGAAAARNRALHLAQGSYIQWLDADDLLSPDKVLKQMQIAEEVADPHVLLAAPWASFMYRLGKAKYSPTSLWEDLSPVEWVIRKWTRNLHMQTATWLVSRELSEAAGPWNTELLGDDDGEYFTRVVLRSREVRFASGAAVFYRVVGSDRLSYIGKSSRKLEAHLKSMRLQIDYLRTIEDTPRVHAAIVAYLESWLPHFYPERRDLVEEMNQLAASVGAELKPAFINPKYAVIDDLFGRRAAKMVQLQYNNRKKLILRSWDKLVFTLLGDSSVH